MGIRQYQQQIKRYKSFVMVRVSTGVKLDPTNPLRAWNTYVQVVNNPKLRGKPLVYASRVTTPCRPVTKFNDDGSPVVTRSKQMFHWEQVSIWGAPRGLGHAGEFGTLDWAKPDRWKQGQREIDVIRVSPRKRVHTVEELEPISWDVKSLVEMVNGIADHGLTRPLIDWLEESVPEVHGLFTECGPLVLDKMSAFDAINHTTCVFD